MSKVNENSILKNKNFMLLWFGQLISLFGNNIHSLAVMWYVKEVTGSTAQMGMSLIFSQLPFILVSPIAGTVADRCDRKKIIVFTDLINGILVGIIALLIYSHNMEIEILYIISAIMSLIKAFFSPAIAASVPSIVHKDNLIKANSMTQFTRNIAAIFGPILAGVLIAAFGIPFMFLLDSISYILSSVSESFIHIPKVKSYKLKSSDSKNKNRTIEDIKAGFHYTFQNKELLHFIIVGGVIINFFTAPLSMFIPLFSDNILNMGSKAYGILMSSLAIGSLIMTFLVPLLSEKFGHYTLTFIGLTCEGIFMILFSMCSNFYSSIISLLLLGASFGMCNVSLGTVFQTLISNELMGRVSSIMGILCSITIPLGCFLAGVALEMINISIILLFSGIVVTIAGFSTIKIALYKDSEQKEIPYDL